MRGEPDIEGFIDDLVGMPDVQVPAGEHPRKTDTRFRRMIIRSMHARGLVPDDCLLFGLEADAAVRTEDELLGTAFSQEECDIYNAYLNEEFLSGIGGRGDAPGLELYLDATCLNRVARDLSLTEKEVYDAVVKVKKAKGLIAES